MLERAPSKTFVGSEQQCTAVAAGKIAAQFHFPGGGSDLEPNAARLIIVAIVPGSARRLFLHYYLPG